MRASMPPLAGYHTSYLLSFSLLQLWACSSAQDGDYLNVGRVNNQVDPTNGLSLMIQRSDAHEQYHFHTVAV